MLSNIFYNYKSQIIERIGQIRLPDMMILVRGLMKLLLKQVVICQGCCPQLRLFVRPENSTVAADGIGRRGFGTRVSDHSSETLTIRVSDTIPKCGIVSLKEGWYRIGILSYRSRWYRYRYRSSCWYRYRESVSWQNTTISPKSW